MTPSLHAFSMTPLTAVSDAASTSRTSTFLEDQFADLAVLLRHRPVAVHDDVVCNFAIALGLLRSRFEGLHHLMAPSVAVVGVR